MIKEDIGSFFETLPLCQRAKVLLIAGTVTKEFYINEFIRDQAQNHGFELAGCFERGGQANFAFYELKNRTRKWPVFYCSVGPGADSSYRLIQRVTENRERLISYLNCSSVTNN